MVNGIYTKSFLERNQAELPEWQRIAFELLAETVADDADTFPCIPGRQAFLTDQLRIAFAGDPRKTVQRRNWHHCLRSTARYRGTRESTHPSLCYLIHRKIWLSTIRLKHMKSCFGAF